VDAARRWNGTLLALLAMAATVPRVAWAQAPAPPASTDQAAAEQAADRGRVNYELGEYAQAVDNFTRAYELSRNRALLFNIAQSHRLAGNCNRALEVYRHFLRLEPASPARVQAQKHVDDLQSSCRPPSPPPPPPPPAPAPAPAPALSAPSTAPGPERPGRSPRQRNALLALGAGALLLVTAGGFYLRNSGRFEDWQREDRELERSADPMGLDSWLRRQDRNNQLWSSIRKEDRLGTALAVAGGALLVTGLVLLAGPGSREAPPRAPLAFTW
jgi:tetratricopeptide (TPR) repeat protein